MSWWLTYLTLQGKIIDINNFKTDILSNGVDDSRLDF